MKKLIVAFFAFSVLAVSVFGQTTTPVVNGDLTVIGNAGTANGEYLRQFDVAENVENFTVMIAFLNGDPAVTLIPPTGTVAQDTDQVSRFPHGIVVMRKGIPGRWTAKIANVQSKDAFEMKVMTAIRKPELSLVSPRAGIIDSDGKLTLKIGMANIAESHLLEIQATDDPDAESGIPVGSVTVAGSGTGVVACDLSQLQQGDYRLFARLDMGDQTSIYLNTGITVHLQYRAALQAPVNLVVAASPDGNLRASWELTQPGQVLKCRVKLTYADGKVEEIVTGSGTSVSLQNFQAGSTVKVQVIAEDANGGTAATEVKSVTFTAPPSPINAPQFSQKTAAINYFLGDELPVYKLSIKDSFARTGGAQDWVRLVAKIPREIGMAEDGKKWAIRLNAEKIRYNAANGETNFELYFDIPAATPVGVYSFPVQVVNIGDPRQTDTVNVTLTVKNPPIVVSGITPNIWPSGSSLPALSVAGSGFGMGVSVAIDGVELPIQDFKPDQIKLAAADTVLPVGKHTLTVKGPGGSASAEITVQPPTYALFLQKSRSKAIRGGKASFWIGVKPLSGFNGVATFSISGKPAGWTVNADKLTVSADDSVQIDAVVPANAPSGTYNLTVMDGQGISITLAVDVTDQAPNPTISSLSTPSSLPGQSLRVFGYGFGDKAGQLKLGSRVLTTSAWSDQSIDFTLPNDAKSGTLSVVATGGVSSNQVFFLVLDAGFSIVLDKAEYRQQPGDAFTLHVLLNGLAKPVNLLVDSSDPLISASYDKATLTPIGATQLRVKIDPTITNGIYTLTLRGQSESFQNNKTLQIIVGNAFEMPDQVIPAGKQGSAFRYQIITRNGQGNINFKAEDGQLPPGLVLTKDGMISGVPASSGAYSISVVATDGKGRKRTAKLAIFIDENVWNPHGGDDGHTAYAPGMGPADGRIAWTQSSDGTPVDLLSGANKVFTVSSAGIAARDPETGKVFFRIAGSFSDISYRRSHLACISTAGLVVYDTSTGKELWRRDGVTQAFMIDSLVLAQTAAEILQLSLEDGHLIEKGSGHIDGQFLLWNGVVVRQNAGKLEKLAGSGWVPVIGGIETSVVNAVFDAEGALVSLNNGKLLQLDANGKILHELAIRGQGRLVLGTYWFAVVSSSGVETFKRENAAPLAVLPAKSIDAMIGSDSHLYTLSNGQITCWNVYAGNPVWSSAQNIKAFLVRAGNILALNTAGSLQLFDAPDNIQSPVSIMTVFPVSPDGHDGWYISKPSLSLSASDKETFVTHLYLSISGNPAVDYQGPLVLGEGSTQISFGSMDNGLLRETDHLVSFKVDSIRPVSSYQVRGDAAKAPYFTRPVAVSLSATDQGSGLLHTEYSLNGAAWTVYAGKEFRFEQEGRNQLSVRSTDVAGGVEATQNREFIIDLTPPEIGLSYKKFAGATLVYLYADDSASGVDKIEYKIDGGPVQTYAEPLSFNSGGSWKVAYHAIDKAGRDSGWKDETVRVSHDKDSRLIDDLRYFDNNPGRQRVEDAQMGMEIFTARRPDRFKLLPEEIKGFLYLQNLESDGLYKGKNLSSFRSADDLVVYVLKDTSSQAALLGYEKIRDYPAGALSNNYFRKGASLYRQAFAKGKEIVIPGAGLSANGGDCVFIGSPPWNGLTITQPHPGAALVAGNAYALALNDTAGLDKVRWQYRSEQGAWTDIGIDAKSFTIPNLDDGSQLEIRAQSTRQKQVIEANGFWLIKNQTGIEFQGINQHGTVTQNEAFDPAAIAVAADGTKHGEIAVTYRLSAGKTLIAQGSGPFIIAKLGHYELSAIAIMNGVTLKETRDIVVLPKGAWTHAFHPKHERRHGRYLDDKRREHEIEWDDWNPEDNLEIQVPNGWYEVRLVLLPEKAWTVYTSKLNGLSGGITCKEAQRLHSSVYQLQVTDGKLKLLASDHFPLVRLEYRKIENLTRPSYKEAGILNGLEN